MITKEAQTFLNTDGYETSESKRPTWCARFLPGVTISFYLEMIRVIIHASRLAKRDELSDSAWAEHSLMIMAALEKVGVKIQITGIRNLAATSGPVVFIGNHMSVLETFVLPAIILPYKPLTFVVKQSLIDYPVFKHIMRTRHPIVVGRKNAREDLVKVLQQGEERLKDGISVMVFPQSTRTVDFSRAKFNTLGIKLAKRSNLPILPIAIKSDAWGNGHLLKDFGPIDRSKKVHFELGTPLTVEARGNEVHEKILNFIEDRLNAWKVS